MAEAEGTGAETEARVMARGRADRAPLLALGAVTLAVGALVAVILAIGLAIYFFA